MGKVLLGLALVVGIAACGKSGENSVWQWVDEKGSVQFAESLDDVPEAHRTKAGKIPMSARAFARKTSVERAPTRPAPANAAPTPVGPITLYFSSTFSNHTDALEVALQQAGVAYQKIDVEKDDAALDHLKQRSRQQFPNLGDGYASPMMEHGDAFFFGDGEASVALLKVHLDWVRRGRPIEIPAVYMTTRCGYSQALLKDLEVMGQPYQAYDVDFDSDAAGRLVDATGSARVPVTMVNGKVIVGYDPRTAKQITEASLAPPVPGGLRGFFTTLVGS